MNAVKSSDYSYFERLLNSVSDCSGLYISVPTAREGLGNNCLGVDINRYPNRDYSTIKVDEFYQPGRTGVHICWSSEWSFKSRLGIVLFAEESPIMDGSWIVVKYPLSQILEALRGVPQWVKNEITKGLPTLVWVALPRTSFKVGDVYYNFSVDVQWRDDVLVSQPSINSEWPSEIRETIAGFASQPEVAVEDSDE